MTKLRTTDEIANALSGVSLASGSALSEAREEECAAYCRGVRDALNAVGMIFGLRPVRMTDWKHKDAGRTIWIEPGAQNR